MADEFDKELDQAPEGSILAPIFIGCGAMGLGCLLSVAVIVIGFLIFAPGIWSTIMAMGDNPMLEAAMPLVESNEEVVAALGTPIEAELDDINEAPGADLGTIEIGDEIELLATYDLSGPNGTARLETVGTRALVAEDEWELTTVTVILDGGHTIRVFPADAPDAPAIPAGGGAVWTPEVPEMLDTLDGKSETAAPNDATEGDGAAEPEPNSGETDN